MEKDETSRGLRGRGPRKRQALWHRMFYVGFLFLWVLFLSRQPVVNARTQQADVTADQWKEFLSKYNSSDGKKPTYSQIHQWVEEQAQKDAQNQSITPDLYPRLFPFCVTLEQIMDTKLTSHDSDPAKSKLFQFKPLFELIKSHDTQFTFYHFNPDRHSVVRNTTFIKSVELRRINTPEHDMINLRQWAHVEIKSNKPLKGLYVQSLVGPLGLPQGDFNLDFPCNDLQGAEGMEKIGELYHCHYRPRANIWHPRVYVGYDMRVPANPGAARTSWHVHFQWTDISCMETPYLQFLILAVENFKAKPALGTDYDIVFSPVFVATGYDSNDGSPYPYHPTMENMLCGADSTAYVNATLSQKLPENPKPKADSRWDPLKWTISDKIFRIQPNEEYDACIRGTGRQDILDQKDSVRMECPPGGFRCTKSNQVEYGCPPTTPPTTSCPNQDKIRIHIEELVESEKNVSDCKPCAPIPPCIELFSDAQCTGKKPEIVTKNDTGIVENFETVARSKSHGILAILSTMVLVPIANFMGRHYKEVCRNCLCGNGPWIFVHVIFHFLSAIILWLSIGPVVASISDYDEVLDECASIYTKKSEQEACASDKSVKNPHVPTGIVVFVLENLLIIFGFFRSSKNKMRLFQLIAHSHLGYFTFILATVSALLAVYNNDCMEGVILLITLFVFPVFLHIISCALDCMTDKKVGVSPGRRQYPILEPIRLEKRGPCEPCKWCVFAILFLGMMALWFMVVLSATFASRKDPDKFNPQVPAGSVSQTFSGEVFEGLFGACGYVAGKTHGQRT